MTTNEAPAPAAFVPADNYVLRLERKAQPLIGNTVLDLVVLGGDTVALARWRSSPSSGGFTLTRIDVTGNVVWQTTFTPCGFPPTTNCSGVWDIESGALVRTPKGFLVAGMFRPSGGSSCWVAVAGFDAMGKAQWMRSYFSTSGSGPTVVSIVPLDGGSVQFLVGVGLAGRNWSWFFSIDLDGKSLGPGYRFEGTAYMTRLRTTPTQGIFAVGRRYNGPEAGGWVLSIDPASGLPRWERIYLEETAGAGIPMWADIAEGARALVVVGGIAPDYLNPTVALIAGLQKVGGGDPRTGELKWALSPQFEQITPDLDRVVNRQAEPVPIREDGDTGAEVGFAPAAMWSRFAVCGALNRRMPWLFLIDDEGVLDWQKTFLKSDQRGRLSALVWPGYDDIVAGGTTTGSDGKPMALVVSSESVPRSGSALRCSQPAGARFPREPMRTLELPIRTVAFGPHIDEWTFVEGPPQPPLEGCPE